MLVTFSTQAYANIMVFGDIAHELLKMMGHSGSIPGAIVADDVGDALNHLKTAIEHSVGQNESALEETAEDQNLHQTTVSLRNRALPLIELLSAAESKKCDVMWK